MRTPSPESAHRLGEIALLSSAFLLPLAFYLRTYDSVAIKYTILQWGALTMLFAWLWQGLARGRFSAPASSWTALLPAAAYGAWMILRFALEPHKLGAMPEFLTQLTMLVAFLAAFLGFAGARSASRLATLTVASAWLVALYGIAQAAGVDPFVWKGAFGTKAFSTLANPYLCASFLALAVPLALTLTLDPETPPALRAAATAFLPAAAIAAVLTGSAPGVAAFALSCLLYAAIVAAVLRTRAAFKSAGLAVLVAVCAAGGAWLARPPERPARAVEARRLTVGAELRMVAERPLTGFGPGSFAAQYPRFRSAEAIKLDGHLNTAEHPELPVLGVAVELGLIGAALWVWLFGAALWTGAAGAAALRRAGALPESVYAAGFAAAAAGALASAHLGWASYSPAPGWFGWILAGLAAGLAPLAARRAAVSVYPLPVSESVRSALYAPSLLAFAALAVFPGLWLRSEVRLNEGIYFAKGGDLPRAVALFDEVRPGTRYYVMSRYFKGNALADMRRWDEALAAYGEAQAQAPDYLLVHAKRGEAYAKLGDWKAAASERAKQAALDPFLIDNLVAWAEAARASGDLEQARVAAGQAAVLDANDPRVKTALAANLLVERRRLNGVRVPGRQGVARKPKLP